MSAISSLHSGVSRRASGGQRVFQRCWEGSTAWGMEETGLQPHHWVTALCPQQQWAHCAFGPNGETHGPITLWQQMTFPGICTNWDSRWLSPCLWFLGLGLFQCSQYRSHSMLQIEYGLQNKCFAVFVRLKRRDMRIRQKIHKSKSSGTREWSIVLLFQTDLSVRSSFSVLHSLVREWHLEKGRETSQKHQQNLLSTCL